MTIPNRLAREKSPYLRQHAHNPVDWRPWDAEALELARTADKPIFLSIGYATCHWCHVMERESFEDPALAALINEHFVPVKVDREERPDLDHLYMAAVQAVTGRGGWPMTLALRPDGAPFFAGTYFPPQDRGGLPGLGRVLEALVDAWRNRRAEIDESAGSIAAHLREEAHATASPAGGAAPGRDAMDAGFRALSGSFDPAHGGFGHAPKFPSPHQLRFLLRYHARTGEARALHMAVTTLEHIVRGGIRDHLGGGFHRYSTDPQWLAPHFEKMLYDQAGLVDALVDAWRVTGRADFAGAARDACEYVLRDLRDPAGGFHSAEDADSEGEEGRFYVWTRDEVDAALGADAELFAAAYDITASGNWEHRNILRLPQPMEEFERGAGRPAAETRAALARARARLLEARARRPRPLLDDKVLAAWNGMMIGALARAGTALDEPHYVTAASGAADFAWDRMRRDGALLRRWHSGSADIPAYLEDYAHLSRGMLHLYEATFEPRHMERSLELAREMDRRFRDPEDGGYNFSGEGNEELLAPHKDVHDGATPSGNSVAADALLRLGALTGDDTLAARGREVLEAFAETVDRGPHAFTEMLLAADFLLGPTAEIVIAGAGDAPEVAAMIRAARGTGVLPRVVACRTPDRGDTRIEESIPRRAGMDAVGRRATAHVCWNRACGAPVHTAAELERVLVEGWERG
ncbi:MAG: thioredoxin domain-containing protein [Candidatus Eisenbacteria bacterium]|nr:thioredoxin domain-containing protein [Candidatus Eisenbacteria bacterium]